MNDIELCHIHGVVLTKWGGCSACEAENDDYDEAAQNQ